MLLVVAKRLLVVTLVIVSSVSCVDSYYIPTFSFDEKKLVHLGKPIKLSTPKKENTMPGGGGFKRDMSLTGKENRFKFWFYPTSNRFAIALYGPGVSSLEVNEEKSIYRFDGAQEISLNGIKSSVSGNESAQVTEMQYFSFQVPENLQGMGIHGTGLGRLYKPQLDRIELFKNRYHEFNIAWIQVISA